MAGNRVIMLRAPSVEVAMVPDENVVTNVGDLNARLAQMGVEGWVITAAVNWQQEAEIGHQAVLVFLTQPGG
jgi:hypothetical protein